MALRVVVSYMRDWGCRPYWETGAPSSLLWGAAEKGWRAPAGSQNHPQPWIELTEFRSWSSPLIMKFLFSSECSSRRSRSLLDLCRRSQLLYQSRWSYAAVTKNTQVWVATAAKVCFGLMLCVSCWSVGRGLLTLVPQGLRPRKEGPSDMSFHNHHPITNE